MSDPAARAPTYQDLFDLPEHVVGEILGGEIHVTPRPRAAHAVASSRLGARLGPPYDFGEGGPGGWWILVEPELHLGEDILVPDLAGWRRERVPDLLEMVAIPVAP
ncbi:MAG: Uma2 family endonuclease, partial [Pseudomonadota bacterium]